MFFVRISRLVWAAIAVVFIAGCVKGSVAEGGSDPDRLISPGRTRREELFRSYGVPTEVIRTKGALTGCLPDKPLPDNQVCYVFKIQTHVAWSLLPVVDAKHRVRTLFALVDETTGIVLHYELAETY